jgi:subtilisin family serine protease
MDLPARRRPLTAFVLAAAFALIAALTATPASAQDGGTGAKHCRSYPRLVPHDYAPNAEQFDAVCLPEAWHFMQDRWQALSYGGPRWPSLVVIDDGFFSSHDSALRPWLFRGYPDGSGVQPNGTADGDFTFNPPAYGLHGTRVLSLLASDVGNGWIAGVVGPWKSPPGTSAWGAGFVLARSGNLINPSTPALLEQIFRDVVLPRPQNRVVNVSQHLASIPAPGHAGLGQMLDQADWNQTVVVTGAGNNKEVIGATAWIRNFPNVVVVGGLNPNGTALWRETIMTPKGPKEIGSATGGGVDLYAPAQGFDLILRDAQMVTDSGTSFAAPLVAGAVAMMQNVDPTLDSWILRDVLVKTADPGTYPRLNVLKALLCVDTIFTGTIWANPPIRTWECETETFGTFRGERVGW